MKAKKILALLLILCMAASLFACGDAKEQTPEVPDAPGETADTPDSGESDEKQKTPELIGFFDREFDYSEYPKYKVAFLSAMNDALTVEWDAAYEKWAESMNIDYTNLWCPVSGSKEEFLSGIQTFCDQGYDGLLICPDSTTYPRVIEVLSEYDVPWFPCLSQARDFTGDGRLYAPSCGYDHYYNGVEMTNKLISWKEENFPEVSYDKVGLISVTYSVIPEIHIRTDAAEQRWAEINPDFGTYDELVTVNPKNFWICDLASGTPDQVTTANMVTQVISSNADIEVWLVAAPVDYYAMGAANALANLNMVDNGCVVAVGGSSLREQFDSGLETAWRYAYISSASLFTECPISALWAYMAGLATPETIWSEWVNPNDKGDVFDTDGNLVEEHNYATLLMRSEWIDKNNYKDYLEWSDLYQFGEGEEGFYDYEPVTDLDLFRPFDEPPTYD